MIVRIVRMYLKPEAADEFAEIFWRTREGILGFAGCQSLVLFQDTEDPNKLTTISYWDTAESLEHYRKSAYFRNVWDRVKPLFEQPSEAFSLEPYHEG